MKNMNPGLLLAGALAVGGCAATAVDGAPAASGQAPAQEQVQDSKGDEPMTGSRLAKRTSTDRMLKSVGAQEARNAMDSNPRPLNANGQ